MSDLDHQNLVNNLDYNPETGFFQWKIRGQGRQLGKNLGGPMANGYIQLKFEGQHYLVHRLAWFYMYKEWPKQHIDHINGDRADNRISNLRDVSHNVNCQNIRKAHKDSASGVLGVRKYKGSYRAHITVDSKVLHLGTFATQEEASAAYKLAKQKYHPEAPYGFQ